ncbi:1-phosphatidylinositol 4,5-bisphosphate phosphodiesterase zeta-1 [Pelobates fuscus]
MLGTLKVPLAIIHLKCLFKAEDHNKDGLIDLEGFKSIYKALIQRKELADVYKGLVGGYKALSAAQFLNFIRKDLSEFSVTPEAALDLIAKYEPVSKAKKDQCMTFEGFARFMNSPDNYVFVKDRVTVYQDMTQPLCDYFISTSHNTYLISDQLVGKSHLWAYQSALMKGCRCVEIDCWDGPDGEPMVYHGHTLTSKLLFKTVIYVIDKCAFLVSPYPLILSLENHCSPKQQEAMAFYLKSILGDKLLTMPVGNSFSSQLPSPEDLKFKILIKNKKIGELEGTILSYGMNKSGQTGDCIEDIEDICANEETPSNSAKKLFTFKFNIFKRKEESKSKKVQNTEKETLAPELSDLVIYTKSVAFRSFQHSTRNQKFYELNSISEGVCEKLVKESAPECISHNMKFITRIYPKSTRASSSNFNPQMFWNVGCQMVALNFQTPGIPMDLLVGKFNDNGGCGYILKPEFLRNPKLMFNTYNLPRSIKPITLSIKIISGFLLPPCSLSVSNTADSLVSVEIFGVPADQSKKQTQVTKNNAFNPRWNQPLTFHVHVPELAMIRFCVEDQLSLVSNEFLGQYTLPLTCMSKGFRHVPLLNKHGQTLVPASLFVHVWYH